jgi:hypothetical protein
MRFGINANSKRARAKRNAELRIHDSSFCRLPLFCSAGSARVSVGKIENFSLIPGRSSAFDHVLGAKYESA